MSSEVKPKEMTAEEKQQKYYADKAEMERAINESICNFVFIYGGRLNVVVEAVAEDTRLETGAMVNRRVWTEVSKVTVSKD